MKRIALVFIISMSITASTGWAVQFDVTKISGSVGHSNSPDINDNGDVVWSGDDNNSSEYEIYLRLFESPTILKLTENNFYDNSPHISNDADAVWYSYQSGIGYKSFWSENQSTPNELSNSIHTWASYQSESNDINANGDIVWFGHDGNDDEIYLRTSDGIITQITNNSHNDVKPKITDDGSIIWETTEMYPDIMYWSSDTGIITIFNNEVSYVSHVRVSRLGNVVWSAKPSYESDYEIFYWSYGDLAPHILTYAGDDKIPQINDSGAIVWEKYIVSGEGGNEIYYWKPSYDSPRRLTDNSYTDSNPSINSSGEIAWYTGYPDYKIRHWSPDTEVTSIVSDANGHNYPIINDAGQIVFISTEIYLASKKNEIDTDSDTIPDSEDNCPLIPNTDQSDLDKDNIGDVCDDICHAGTINIQNFTYPNDSKEFTCTADTVLTANNLVLIPNNGWSTFIAPVISMGNDFRVEQGGILKCSTP